MLDTTKRPLSSIGHVYGKSKAKTTSPWSHKTDNHDATVYTRKASIEEVQLDGFGVHNCLDITMMPKLSIDIPCV
jgi:hypothetical protein